MRIVYCNGCREVIPPHQLQSGEAVLHDNLTYCPKCAMNRSWSKSGMDVQPAAPELRGPAGGPRRRSSGLDKLPGGGDRPDRPSTPFPRRSSNTNETLPLPGRGAAPPAPARGRRPARGAKRSLGNRTILFASIVAGVVLFAGILAWALSGSSGTGPPVEPGTDPLARPGPGPEKDPGKEVYEDTLEKEKRLGRSIDDLSLVVKLWQRAMPALAGSSYRELAAGRLRDATQSLFDETARRATELARSGDRAGALEAWRSFARHDPQEPWKTDASLAIDDIEKAADMPRPDGSWQVIFDGTGMGGFCPDEKHTQGAWTVAGSVLRGNYSGEGQSSTHCQSNVKNFALALQYRIVRGSFLLQKRGSFVFTFPATEEEVLGQWHQVVLACEGEQGRLWVNGREVKRPFPGHANEGVIDLVIRGSDEVEFRDIKIKILP
ncbi:MAG: hypothetical protein HY720_11015 [Planctomycetes bacterium]|nr:hypothetical protein [Planctomycetota bacterium]